MQYNWTAVFLLNISLCLICSTMTYWFCYYLWCLFHPFGFCRKAMALRDASHDGDQQWSGPSDFNKNVQGEQGGVDLLNCTSGRNVESWGIFLQLSRTAIHGALRHRRNLYELCYRLDMEIYMELLQLPKSKRCTCGGKHLNCREIIWLMGEPCSLMFRGICHDLFKEYPIVRAVTVVA